MRHPKEITAEEENFRTEPMGPLFPDNHRRIKRDPVEPESVGTYVLCAFRIDGYDPDCDGSLMWRGSNVYFDDPLNESGWTVSNLGLYKGSDIIVTEDELKELYARCGK